MSREIQGTTIMAGIKLSPSTTAMTMSVKILSLNVRFGNPNDSKMVPTFVRCFPNLETLNILVFCHRYLFTFYTHTNFLWSRIFVAVYFVHCRLHILVDYIYLQVSYH
ncbi:hypothetical protein BRADI_5g03442v3 [Brachypodium distachyon]|uniref:F-box/LRR-repeat protein 15/At3g58940/PEG3-like LRR domain-containing protein n=1 Tax=Brachypodium distachyon TaxID=15368 RepID=A0A2K2CF99_BRADI|nr:hypothetical protein BRADI_5g03442v3 [Brachypodium distachyon]